MHKSALVAALLFSACSCVTVMAAENIPANSQIFKEAKSLPKIPANPKVFTGKAEVIQMSQQVSGGALDGFGFGGNGGVKTGVFDFDASHVVLPFLPRFAAVGWCRLCFPCCGHIVDY